MAKRKRRRPEAGIELVHNDEHYSAVLVSDPESGEQHIRVYSQPHHDLVFKVGHEGPLFWCKPCREEHLLSWEAYSSWVQSPQDIVRICPLGAGTFKTYNTLTNDTIELIAKIRSFI